MYYPVFLQAFRSKCRNQFSHLSIWRRVTFNSVPGNKKTEFCETKPLLTGISMVWRWPYIALIWYFHYLPKEKNQTTGCILVFLTPYHTSFHEFYLKKTKRFQLKLGPPTIQDCIHLASVCNTCPSLQTTTGTEIPLQAAQKEPWGRQTHIHTTKAPPKHTAESI